MTSDIRTTVVGNLCDEPDLRFTPSGAAVVSFTVASNPRRWDREAGEWVDGEPSFVRCQAWRQLAENIAESVVKGDRVIITGVFAEERWETEAGEKRAAWRLTAEAAGPDLSFARATVTKVSRRRDEVAPDDPWLTASKTRPTNAAG